MKINHQLVYLRLFFILISLFLGNHLLAQQQISATNHQNNFWNHVQVGGGIGVSLGSGYTDIAISPSAIYNINSIFSAGTALQFGYVSSKNYYTSTVYGASLIGLANPIPEIQLSAELEEVNVNNNYRNIYDNYSENFWITSLYLGVGYRSGNVTIGGRYNVLFDKNKTYYSDAFMPFVRVYF